MITFREMLINSPLLGFSNANPAAGIIERIGPDWDWIWIDGQHGQLSYNDILAAVRACNLIDRPAVVRVPGHEVGTIGKVLDTAADAVMVPLVDTAEQAKAIVAAAKFPPVGSRSYGGRRPIDLFGRIYANADHPQPLLICQIESEKGLENAAPIAAVEGVDVLFFSPGDIARRRGLCMDKAVPKGYFDDALKIMVDATKSNDKIAGGIFTSVESVSEAIKLGYKLISSAQDNWLLSEGSKKQSQMLRHCLKNAPDIKS